MNTPKTALRLAVAFGLHALTAVAGNAATPQVPLRPVPSALIITGDTLPGPVSVNLSGGQSPQGGPGVHGVMGALTL